MVLHAFFILISLKIYDFFHLAPSNQYQGPDLAHYGVSALIFAARKQYYYA